MRVSLLLSALLLSGCAGPVDPVAPPVVPGAPRAGAAEGTLDLPVGTPLGGYSGRSTLLGSQSRPDRRAVAYNTGFAPSAGWQTRPAVRVLWLDNDDKSLVLVKVDLIYSNDQLVQDLTERLSAATGQDLHDQVIVTASHSHQSYGPFADQFHFYLGGDRFNREIYERLLTDLETVALQARDDLEPVEIGTAWARDWDPQDRVYRDRRQLNDDLVVWDDAPAGMGKDPHLNVLRVDRLDGTPKAVAFTFGIHGTAVGEDSPMISSEAPGHIELAVAAAFDTPVLAMHLQGSGGDASPAGQGERFERIENVGARAVEGILDLWGRTPTSTAPLSLESVSRAIPENHDQIRVTRNGAVDWRYAPLYEGLPDDVIYAEDGSIQSPIDEFNAPYGAAFCGSDAPLIPAGDIGSRVFPYSACMDVELVTRLLYAVFDLEEGVIGLPLPETLKAGTTSALIGPLATLTIDGEQVERDLFVGFFPGEPTAMFGEQFRRRALDELGQPQALMVGYAQDHEGYLLIPEDWLLGGYEPNINVWGPLQAEHIMEQVLLTSDAFLGNGVHDRADVSGIFAPTRYPDVPLPDDVQPDRAPLAGTVLTDLPTDGLWTPDDLPVVLDVPATVPRVQGLVQLAWIGGDSMVDLPTITVEHQVDGRWVPVTTPSGRPVTDALPDLLTTWTPAPLYPVYAEQTHHYWTVWQAVAHAGERAALPLGTYRLHVTGDTWTGEEDTWPWTTTPYEVTSATFEVVPARIDLSAADGGFWAWLPGPEHGYRMVDVDGHARGTNPLRGALTVLIDGVEHTLDAGSPVDGRTWVPLPLDGAGTLEVRDAWDNQGTLSLR